jgi:hypothetical protein
MDEERAYAAALGLLLPVVQGSGDLEPGRSAQITRKRKPMPGPAELGVWAVKVTHMAPLTAHTRRRRLMGRAAALREWSCLQDGSDPPSLDDVRVPRVLARSPASARHATTTAAAATIPRGAQ